MQISSEQERGEVRSSQGSSHWNKKEKSDLPKVKPYTSVTIAQEKYFLVFCTLCLHSLLLYKAIHAAKIK